MSDYLFILHALKVALECSGGIKHHMGLISELLYLYTPKLTAIKPKINIFNALCNLGFTTLLEVF